MAKDISPTTASLLSDIDLLAAEASPLPWDSKRGYEQSVPGVYVVDVQGQVVASDDCGLSPQDADYIAAACNLAPALVARVAELEAENQRLKAGGAGVFQ